MYMVLHVYMCDTMKMNKSEIKGYNWLISKGYTESDIVFQGRSTPDFLTSDDKGWEIKRLYGKNLIWMSASQFKRIKQMENTQVVIFTDDLDLPISEIASNELKEGIIFDGIRLQLPKSDPGRVISLDENSLKILRNTKEIMVNSGQSSSYSDAIRNLAKSTFNLCQNCIHDFVECEGTPQFGNGKGNDNVFDCDKFKLGKAKW